MRIHLSIISQTRTYYKYSEEKLPQNWSGEVEYKKTCLEREGACVGYRLQASSQQILMAFPLTNKWVIGFQGEKIEPIAL